MVAKRIEAERYKRFQEECDLYDIECRRYDALSKQEKADTPPPREPVQQRLVCGDTTTEALRDILKDSGGARKVAALWDELSGFFASFDAYRQRKGVSRDRALYLELFNGGPRTIDRAGKRCVFVPNWSACISGTITPSVLSEVFEKLNTDGLLQRFLLYQAELLGPGEDRKPLYAAEDKLVNVVQRLLSFKPNPGGTTTKLTDGAQAVREKF